MKMRWFGWFLFLLLILGGCERSSPETEAAAGPPAATRLPGILVESGWLAAELGAGDLAILDARPPEAYAAGHLPGAVSLPTTETFDEENLYKLPPVPVVERLLGAAGVTAGRRVVVYDQGNFRWSARLFWMLEVHGHEQTAILDGGFARWVAEGRPVSTEPVTPAATEFIANVLPEHLVSKLQVRQAMEDASTVILDARSPREYRGEEARWPRNGHIPGAVNVEWQRNLEGEEGDEQMKTVTELRELYPFPSDTKVITYCTRGRRAAVSYLALRLAGFEAAVYDGSWNEWTADPALPVEP